MLTEHHYSVAKCLLFCQIPNGLSTYWVSLWAISTSGCKLRVYGNMQDWLQPGVVYRNLLINMPSFREIQLPVELRYTNYDSSQNRTFLGFKFHDIDGLLQRDLARYVTQLQREFRRNVL